MLFCIVIGLCLVGGAYGASMTVVDLPATDTDAAIGIDASKTYTHAFDFGDNAPAVINGVAFDQGPTGDIYEVYEGVGSQGYGYILDETRSDIRLRSHGGNNPSAYADGSSAEMLRDMVYHSHNPNTNDAIILTLKDLTPGLTYSVRWYYRPWDPPLPRPITFVADDGESIDIDIDLCGGAQYLDYTFVADDNDVTMEFATNNYGQGVHLYGITCEEIVPSMTVVDLPATDTDAAIGIDPNKTYTHAIDFGENAPTVINGVAFDQGPTDHLVGPDLPYVSVSSQGYGYIIDDTRATESKKIRLNAGNNNVNSVADGNSAELLRDMIYYSGGAPDNEGIIVTLQDLVPGGKYSVRWYYRQWDTTTGRPVTVNAAGVEPIGIDIDGPGAHYLDYTFVADDNDVTMTFITGITGEGPHIYGLTCEVVPTAAIVGLGADAAYSMDTSIVLVGNADEFTSLDGTWLYSTASSDRWDGSGIGEGNPGGISTIDGYLRIQDTGDPRDYGYSDPGSNRKLYLLHDTGPDGASATILDDGVTLFFKMRLATDGLLDQQHPNGGAGLTNVPETGDGYPIHDKGKGFVGIAQGADGRISFSLTTVEEYGESGLLMNSLNGTSVSNDVDTNKGTPNLLPLDPTVWHDFWVTIQADTSGVGTHQVDVSVDGAPAETFVVTAGRAEYLAGASYLALGAASTNESGAFDLAAFQFAPGIITP